MPTFRQAASTSTRSLLAANTGFREMSTAPSPLSKVQVTLRSDRLANAKQRCCLKSSSFPGMPWREIARSIDTALATVRDADQQPSGTLRVSLPSSLGSALMPGLMCEFRQQFPEVNLSIDFGAEHVDIVARGFDVAPHQSNSCYVCCD